jgi:hypothetical protein
MQLIKDDKVDILIRNQSNENRMVRLFGAFVQGAQSVNDNELITNSVASGLTPYSFTYSSITNRFYLAGSNNLYIYDTDFTLTNTVALGFIGSFLFVNPVNDELLIGDTASDVITRFDISTESVLGTFSIIPNINPTSCIYNPSNGQLYFTSEGDQTITYINATTYALVGYDSVVLDSGATSAYNPFNESTYFATKINGIYVLNELNSLTQVIGIPSNVRDITYASGNQKMYAIANTTTSILFCISDDNIVFSTTLPYSNSNAIIYNSADNNLYIFFGSPARIGKFDLNGNLLDTYTFTNSSAGLGYFISANNNVYLLSNTTNEVYNLEYSNNISIDGNSLPFVNTDVAYNPIEVYKAHINCQNLSQFSNALNIKRLTLTGLETSFQVNPLVYFNTYKKQNVIDLDLKGNNEWIFDGQRYLEFMMDANNYIQLTFYYRQFRAEGYLDIRNRFKSF